VPGLTVAIATAYRAIMAAQRGEPPPPSRYELEDEVRAWRAAFPEHCYEFGAIQRRPEEASS
jgi:hypothetical protein